MAHIFISYSHKDKAYVSKLYEALTARGFDAWINDRIDYGSEWPREIERRLDACDVLVLVMTPRAHRSKWVQNELNRAQRKGKPVFPLLLEGDEPWLSVESLQYVDVRGNRLPPEDFYNRLEKVAPRSRTLPRAAAVPAQVKPAPKPRPEKPKPVPAKEVAREPRRKPAGKPRPWLRMTALALLGISVLAGIIWGMAVWEPWMIDWLTVRPIIEAATYDTRIRAQDGMTEVNIPAGSFDMGGTVYSNEKPIHRVTLSAFWMDQTEVTNAQYALCVQAGECDELAESSASIGDDHPVVKVDWFNASAYCAWVGGSLPTEAQWEYAARGGLDGMKYPWGNGAPVCTQRAFNGAQYVRCDDGFTYSVGMFSPNGYGLFDMAGNVWEWVNDWYDSSYYSSETTWTDPQGPASGQHRVVRGGSWYNSENLLRVSVRFDLNPFVTYGNCGFRCVRPATP